MPASPIDSQLYGALFGDSELAKLFTDSAEIRAMLLVEGALAEAQAKVGLIPEEAGQYLKRACEEIIIDPAALAGATAQNAVPVPALITAARKEMAAPDHAAWLHFGATSQDIMDTALVLRLRQVVRILNTRLVAVVKALGQMAESYTDMPMLARTYGQPAVASTFGAMIATWGNPLLRHHQRLEELTPRLLAISLSGAAGTLSSMGSKGHEVRKTLADALHLADPEASWHPVRDRIAEFSGWLTMLSTACGKMGEDMIALSSRGELSFSSAGNSSTMPQKQNPVGPSTLSALARHALGLNNTLQAASLHRDARDGAAWLTEWLSLPQLVLVAGRTLSLVQEIIATSTPNAPAMRKTLDEPPQLWVAEALTFALVEKMPRPQAERDVKDLVSKALETGTPLPTLAQEYDANTDWSARLEIEALLGEAPLHARRFYKLAHAL